MNIRRFLPWVVAGLVLAILVLSIDARSSHESSARLEPLAADPPTGAILVDLDDDASSSDRSRVAGLLVSAIAPFDWPAGERAFGQTLSEDAQLFRVEPPASELTDVLRSLASDPDVEAVELERTWSLPEGADAFRVTGLDANPDTTSDRARDADPTRGPFRPNDPYYKHQWHLDQIQMPEAWLRNRGEGAVVAILDTGVLYRTDGRFKQVPDLANTRFVAGYDAIDDDDTPDDEHGHGTHVAGTVAQSTNNGIGVAGVAPEATLMPVRVLDARGSGGWGSLAAGIRWAADHGADVINMSLGGGMPSQVVRRAIEHAHAKGVVIVAAAGNASRARVEYPGAYPHVIAVGAVRFDEELSFYSSYGKGLDVVAPGGDLRVDQNQDGMPDGVLQNTMVQRPDRHDYVAWQGTSMATPHVAGVAALLKAAGVSDPDAVERILVETAKAKRDTRRYGHGLIQANAALAKASQRDAAGGGLALLLGVGLLVALRRKGRLSAPLASTVALGTVLAGGLAIVPFHLVPYVGDTLAHVARGVPALLAEATPSSLMALSLSAAAPLAVIALLLGVKRAAPAVVGLSIAFAAWLAVEAVLPSAHIGLLPSWAAGPWLLAQAGIAATLAFLAARRPV